MRQWQEEKWLQQVNEGWAKEEQREKRLGGIKQMLAKEIDKTPLQLYVNSQGQTMVVIPGPVQFEMGSPYQEAGRYNNEAQHTRRIGRSFAIASKSVTLEQYRSLTKDKYEIGERYTHHPDLPVVGINWYMAAKYCNLLSKEENIPEQQWCYETDAKGQVTKSKENYLSLSGYRLPTEAEMEYAIRAGASSSRYYGATDDLLENYAWYVKNSNELVQRVGMKKPNDFGLFDVLGNSFTWCQEPYYAFAEVIGGGAVEDQEGKLVVGTETRVLRGGSYDSQALNLRSANRNGAVPSLRNYGAGIRPARTLVP